MAFELAAAAVRGFRLDAPPPGFTDDPYPFYAALREHAPLHTLAPGSLLLTRYADVDAVYRSGAVSSDKQREFGPKFGAGTPLFEHHTTSLVFNDPPLHTRVRRLLMGALSQRAIARMEPELVTLVDALLDGLAAEAEPDLIAHFAARIQRRGRRLLRHAARAGGAAPPPPWRPRIRCADAADPGREQRQGRWRAPV